MKALGQLMAIIFLLALPFGAKADDFSCADSLFEGGYAFRGEDLRICQTYSAEVIKCAKVLVDQDYEVFPTALVDCKNYSASIITCAKKELRVHSEHFTNLFEAIRYCRSK